MSAADDERRRREAATAEGKKIAERARENRRRELEIKDKQRKGKNK